jgi:uncharacterized protein YbjT (DUF2867 family)
MEKIFIAGATGNVGRELAYQLKNKSLGFNAGIRDKEKAKSMHWYGDGSNTVNFTFEDNSTWEKAISGCDRAFLISPPMSPAGDSLVLPFIDFLMNRGIRRITFMSAMGVEYNDDAPLRKIEKYLMEKEADYTFLRPNWFMQNFTGMFGATLREQSALYLPAGESKTSYIDTRDIAACAVKSLTDSAHIGGEYTLTGPAAIDHHKIVKSIGEAANKDMKYYPVSDDEYAKALENWSIPKPAIEFIIGLFNIMRNGYTEPVSGDVKKITGNEPMDIDSFAKDYAEVWR